MFGRGSYLGNFYLEGISFSIIELKQYRSQEHHTNFFVILNETCTAQIEARWFQGKILIWSADSVLTTPSFYFISPITGQFRKNKRPYKLNDILLSKTYTSFISRKYIETLCIDMQVSPWIGCTILKIGLQNSSK